jgi:GntR family transcriptional repressor for pyruvate dehydrogenase complex
LTKGLAVKFVDSCEASTKGEEGGEWMSKPLRPPRLADAVAERLQAMMREGVLRPGEKLVGERELARRLDVSRPSLREALGQLEAKGLVVTTKGGTKVAPFLTPLSAPLAALFRGDARVAGDYFEYRRVVEAQAAALAARRASEIDRRAIQALLTDMRAAHSEADPTREANLDADLHIAIYEASHNVVVLHMLRALAELMRGDVFFNRNGLYARTGVREALLAQHIEIAEAVVKGAPEAAEAAAAAHIRFIATTLHNIRADESRQAAALRRIERSDLVSE